MEIPKFIPQRVTKVTRAVAYWAETHRIPAILLASGTSLEAIGVIRNGNSDFIGPLALETNASFGMGIATVNILQSRNRLLRAAGILEGAVSTAGI